MTFELEITCFKVGAFFASPDVPVGHSAEMELVVIMAFEKAIPPRLLILYIEMGWAGCILVRSSTAETAVDGYISASLLNH